MQEKEFTNNCELCGAQCCRNWNPARYDKTIVNENGICKYLNTDTNLCTIYENRPDFCRVYKWYDIQFSQHMSLDKFLSEQKLGCKVLQKISKRRNNK